VAIDTNAPVRHQDDPAGIMMHQIVVVRDEHGSPCA
jgi:hypothetical protein